MAEVEGDENAIAQLCKNYETIRHASQHYPSNPLSSLSSHIESMEPVAKRARIQAQSWETQLKEVLARISELEASHKELQARHEELQARHEELQASYRELQGTAVRALQPSLDVGIGEFRRVTIRELQGCRKNEKKQKKSKSESEVQGPSKTDNDNMDNRRAKQLTEGDFRGFKLEWIWQKHRRFIQNDVGTVQRNEFVHSNSTRNFFAAAMKLAKETNDPKYGQWYDLYRTLFEWTYEISVEASAAEVKGMVVQHQLQDRPRVHAESGVTTEGTSGD